MFADNNVSSDDANINEQPEGVIEDQKSVDKFLICNANVDVNILQHKKQQDKKDKNKVINKSVYSKVSKRTLQYEQNKKNYQPLLHNLIETIPRVNGKMLLDPNGIYNMKKITIVAKYLETKNTNKESKFAAPGGGEIYVQHERNVKFTSLFNEITGIHLGNGLIKQISYQSWGNKFDLSIWNKFVILSKQYPNLF